MLFVGAVPFDQKTQIFRSALTQLINLVTITRLGRQAPLSKQSDGYFRFQCPNCQELRATVNPRNNLAHCFCCGENFNNIDLLMTQGYDFLPAVEILEQWLWQYQQNRNGAKL